MHMGSWSDNNRLRLLSCKHPLPAQNVPLRHRDALELARRIKPWPVHLHTGNRRRLLRRRLRPRIRSHLPVTAARPSLRHRRRHLMHLGFIHPPPPAEKEERPLHRLFRRILGQFLGRKNHRRKGCVVKKGVFPRTAYSFKSKKGHHGWWHLH